VGGANDFDSTDMAVNTPPLLRLAAELRNRIYEYALIEESGVIEVNTGKAYGIKVCKPTRRPRLFQTCRRIRAEGMGIYHAQNQSLIRRPKTRPYSYTPYAPMIFK
jgi:hypothetical protein